MRGEDHLERQRKLIEQEGDCTCLVHHTTNPVFRKELEEVARSHNGALSALAIEGLSPCPTRKAHHGSEPNAG
jgi:hypothetical protein